MRFLNADPRDSRAWWAAIYGVAQSWTRLRRLSSSSSDDSIPFLEAHIELTHFEAVYVCYVYGPIDSTSKRAGLCLPIHTASPELGLGSGTWLVLSEIWVINEGSLLCFFVLSTGLSLLAHSRLSMKIC